MATLLTEQKLAEHRGDHDGKSKTASAVDQAHYPETANEEAPDVAIPTHEEIALLAHRIWELHGCPQNTAEEDWYEAERELYAMARDRSSVAQIHGGAGSVQK